MDHSTMTNSDNGQSSPSQPPAADKIVLDDAEKKLFETLVNTANAYNAGELQLPNDDNATTTNRRPPPATTGDLELRVAGGWVRDKLLGLATHDVDVAVNNLTGVQFARLVKAHAEKQPETVKMGRIGVVAANPAQSKHLETACLRIHGVDVDFNNLRGQEMYESDSRIPIVAFGTPLEDAERRDFTMNALFYNLRTKQVEDWTGRGLSDLQQGRLVTPLCPVTTFRDDPLRVLRAIRFSVRYQFGLDDALQEAALNKEIHKALHVKVSRERVGKELEGMLSGKYAKPIAALRLISHLKLAGSVFALPRIPIDGSTASNVVSELQGKLSTGQEFTAGLSFDSTEARTLRKQGWEEAIRCVDCLPAMIAKFEASKAETSFEAKTKVDLRLLPVATFLLPFRYLTYDERKKKSQPAITYVIREGIKFKNKDVQAFAVLMETVDEMATLLDSSAEIDRLQTGLLLRRAKDLWVTCLLLATVVKMREQENGIDWMHASLQLFQGIVGMGLDECWTLRPLLDGKALIKELNLPRGPEVGNYLQEQMKWMLLNPNGTLEECKAHLHAAKRRRDAATGNMEARVSKKLHVEEGLKVQ